MIKILIGKETDYHQAMSVMAGITVSGDQIKATAVVHTEVVSSNVTSHQCICTSVMICNGVKDCPHHDGAELCYLKDRICPQGCLCFGFVVRCHQLSFHNATTFELQFKGMFFILKNSHVIFVNSCFANNFQIRGST